jgi:hypothetical protein
MLILQRPEGACPANAMNEFLNGAQLKLVRAQEHADSLRAEIRMFLQEHHYEVKSRQVGYLQWELTPVINALPPLRLSTIIGDCLVNARSALDYVMFGLATRYFVPSLDMTKRGDLGITHFPLYQLYDQKGAPHPTRVKRFATLAMRQLPKTILDTLEAAQPYQPGKESLFWLRDLVNKDKHRMPILTIGCIPKADFLKVVHGVKTIIAANVSGALNHTDANIGQTGVRVDCHPTIFVMLKDHPALPRIPVDVLLQQIIDCVANIIPRFEGFLV